MAVKDMPVPPVQLMTLASRLDSFSIALAALNRLQPEPAVPAQPGVMQPIEVEVFRALSAEYLAVRETFETTRAEYETDFMNWRTALLGRTDALFRGEPIPGSAPQVMPSAGDLEPTWANDPATPDSD